MMKPRPQIRDGLAAAELAICLPLLFLITMYCVQLAHGYHLKSVADQAAWRAIRYASTTQFQDDQINQWKSDVTDQAIAELSQLADFNEEDLQIEIEVSSNDDRVEIHLRLDLLMTPTLRLMADKFEVHRDLQIRQYR